MMVNEDRRTWACLSHERTSEVVERSRRNVVAFLCLIVISVSTALMGIRLLEVGPSMLPRLIPATLLNGFLIYAYWWCKTARPVRPIARGVMVAIFSVLWISLCFGGGLETYIIIATTALPVIAAVILGRREAITTTAANGALLAAMLGLNLTGIVDDPNVTVSAAHMVIFAGVLLVTYFLTTVCLANLLLLYTKINAELTAETELNAQLAEESNRTRERFEGFARIASDWLWEHDINGTCTFVAGRFMDELTRPAEAFLGTNSFSIIEFSKDDRQLLVNNMREQKGFKGLRGILTDDNGKSYTMELSGNPIFDHDGNIVGMRGVGENITDKLRAESRINFLAAHDELTGLLNRSSINDHLRRLEESGEGAIMMLIDLDGFKSINDAYGHSAGDEVLRQVAQRLTGELRRNDVVARLGGDEFVIVLPNKDSTKRAIGRLSERLLQELANPYPFEQFELSLSGSIGVAHMPEDAETADQLFVAADLALYAAKQGGRCQSQQFDPSLESGMRRRLVLEKGLREALKNDSLSVMYQPQYGLDGNTLIGFEALARWNHPEEGPIRPDVFIEVAESCGLIIELERQILRKACREAANWPISPNGGQPLRLAVNVSAVQFNHGDLTTDVKTVLKETGLDPSRLEIEITESVLMTDTDRAVRTLENLHDLGVSVAVDDFGTGYSSLSYLQSFPLSRLKIDRSFVQRLGDDDKGASIANAVVQLGHGLGLIVIAEGVETEDQRTVLLNLGCDEVQGFLYSKPVSATGALSIIVRSHTDRKTLPATSDDDHTNLKAS